jgi:transcriptional regulator with XRE-family HTH domain
MKFTEKIKLLRKEREWSQETMAHKLNISLNSYGAIERGDTNLNLSRINEIAEIFDITLESLFENVNYKEEEEEEEEEEQEGKNFKRRKSDKLRRKEDLTVLDIELLKLSHDFEKFKLEHTLKQKELEKVISIQMVNLVDKIQQMAILEDIFFNKPKDNSDEKTS